LFESIVQAYHQNAQSRAQRDSSNKFELEQLLDLSLSLLAAGRRGIESMRTMSNMAIGREKSNNGMEIYGHFEQCWIIDKLLYSCGLFVPAYPVLGACGFAPGHPPGGGSFLGLTQTFA
jgi:hypothetical protein